MTPILDARSLTRTCGETAALDGVTLSVEQGALFGLLGPNGSGKTTMIKPLTSRIRPSGGAAAISA